MAELLLPQDSLPTLATNLVILVGFIGAIIAGLWKGWKEIKPEGPTPTPHGSLDPAIEVVKAALGEAQAVKALSKTNESLEERVRDLDRGVEDMVDELRSNRITIQRTAESLERLIQAVDANTQAIEKAWR